MVRPTRLMSDSVLHFSDNRIAALREIVRAETGLGWKSGPAIWKMIASRKRSRFRYPHTIRLIRWVHVFIDFAASPLCSTKTTTVPAATPRTTSETCGVQAYRGC